jgi:hypothetical protein
VRDPWKLGHPQSLVLGIAVVNGSVILVQCCPCCFYNALEIFCILCCCSSCGSCNCFDALCQCLHYFVSLGDGGVCYVFVFEMDCVRMAFAFGGLDITRVCAIMFWGGEERPPVN